MANVETTGPDIDSIKTLFKPMVEAVQAVAVDAFQIIKDKAILDNEDVHGQQMPPKIPRPKNNPQNFPHLPLIQNTEPDLMNNERSTVENTEDGAVIIYNPPEHLAYLLEKPQVVGGGGRHWIGTDGTINANARAEIEQRIKDKIEGL